MVPYIQSLKLFRYGPLRRLYKTWHWHAVWLGNTNSYGHLKSWVSIETNWNQCKSNGFSIHSFIQTGISHLFPFPSNHHINYNTVFAGSIPVDLSICGCQSCGWRTYQMWFEGTLDSRCHTRNAFHSHLGGFSGGNVEPPEDWDSSRPLPPS